MDIEFTVSDIFAATRPQWKLASNIEEASRAFQLAMAQDQKTAGIEKAAEPEDPDSDASSDDGNDGDGGIADGDMDDASLDSDEEADLEANPDNLTSPVGTESEEESIVVTRQEEDIDPEDEADFEREYAKMMAESLESRKFERKATFDVPLPMKRKDREVANPSESWNEESTTPNTSSGGTMAFSLLTKRGNRQQVTIPLSWTLCSALTLIM
jgi:regulator of nonsense transcripts 2